MAARREIGMRPDKIKKRRPTRPRFLETVSAWAKRHPELLKP